MLPFRELLKPGNSFAWNDELEYIFAEYKEAIAAEVEEGVRIFDKARPTCLATDWSKDGIGFCMFQKHCTCPGTTPFCCRDGWKISLVGSRFTHAAESRYAPIECEALAVADALDKARFFVLGCSDLIVAVDHKPLLKILGDRSLDDITNTRLRNLKEKTLRYRFRMVHISGIHRNPYIPARHYLGMTDQVEIVQRYFTRRVYQRCQLDYNHSYLQRLAYLEIESLELRRIYLDLAMVHKIVRGLITADLKRHFTFAIQAPNSAVRTRGHTFKLKTTRYRLNIAQHLFFNRVVST